VWIRLEQLGFAEHVVTLSSAWLEALIRNLTPVSHEELKEDLGQIRFSLPYCPDPILCCDP